MSDLATVMSDWAPSRAVLDRALRRVTSLWRTAPEPEDGVEAYAAAMRGCLEARGGEVSARARAAALAQAYLAASEAGRLDFLRALASFDSDPEAVRAAYERV